MGEFSVSEWLKGTERQGADAAFPAEAGTRGPVLD